MAVLDIRGTNGSGKSWVVHQILGMGAAKEVRYNPADSRQVIAHQFVLGDDPGALKVVTAVGKYTTSCGGADWLHDADLIAGTVRAFYPISDHVLVEGIMVGHTYRRYNDLAVELGDDYYFLFLDTPLKTCIARTAARRRRRGVTKPFKVHNLINDHERVKAARRKLQASRRRVETLDHRDPLRRVLEILST